MRRRRASPLNTNRCGWRQRSPFRRAGTSRVPIRQPYLLVDDEPLDPLPELPPVLLGLDEPLEPLVPPLEDEPPVPLEDPLLPGVDELLPGDLLCPLLLAPPVPPVPPPSLRQAAPPMANADRSPISADFVRMFFLTIASVWSAQRSSRFGREALARVAALPATAGAQPSVRSRRAGSPVRGSL
jgi:hypothetical protein